MKNKIFNLACVLLVIGIIFSFSGGLRRVVATSANAYKGVILIDPGHGGEDGGAVGINGIKEKDINLPISLILRDVFVNNGYRVILTRDKDCDLGNKDLKSVSARKRSDMQKRVEIINNSKADLLISVHQNHFSESKYSGAQIFYSKEQNKQLAEKIQKVIVKEIQPENNREPKMNEKIYILANSIIPSVIVECGFISNQYEANLLSEENYQILVAGAIYKAVDEYLSLN